MPDETSFDLAKLDAWCGVRPGMTRAQVQEAMQPQGAELDEYGDDNLSAIADDWEMEFYFTTDGTQRLRQLSIDDAKVLWNGRPLLGISLEDALCLLGSPASAVWQAGDASSAPFAQPDQSAATPPTDEQLLAEGTVWLPERGLGLIVSEGRVISVAWRAPQDLPAKFAGPVTTAQRELSKRPDLEDYLQKKRLERFDLARKKDPLTHVRTLVTILTLAALVAVGKLGFVDTRLWSQAPTLAGTLVAVEKVPLKQFREFVPPALRWIFPRTRQVIVDGYRVEFTAPHEEQPKQAVLERGELYVAPQNIGDEVTVVYLDGNPPRTKGPARARDSAFIDYIPWVIAIGALWLLAQIVIGVLPAAFRILVRLTKRLTPSGVVADPDRPELR